MKKETHRIPPPYYVVSWDTNKILSEPFYELTIAKEAARRYGFAAPVDHISNGRRIRAYPANAFVGVPYEKQTGRVNAPGIRPPKWVIVYLPMLCAPPTHTEM